MWEGLIHCYHGEQPWQHNIVHNWQHSIVHNWQHNIVHSVKHNIIDSVQHNIVHSVQHNIVHSCDLYLLSFISLGTNTRKRTVATLPSCGGKTCGSLTEARSCVQHNNADCIMGSWSQWSACSNDCGQGRSRKTRTIIKKEVCRGKKCGVTDAFKVCTDYSSNRNCLVGD